MLYYTIAVFTMVEFCSSLIPLVPNLVPLVSNDLVQLGKWEQMKGTKTRIDLFATICNFDLDVTWETSEFIVLFCFYKQN